MARVIYGVMGNTYGHVARTLAIARRLPEHEFYFVGGGRAAEVLGADYPVLEVPVKRTVHKDQRVAVPATIASIARCLRAARPVRRQIRELIERWQPAIALSDREFFLPGAAHAAGLDCVSIDHSHLLSECRYDVPASQRIPWALARTEDALFFNQTRRNLIVSFFHPALKRPGPNELLPPILRPEAGEASPTNGDHIFVYQTSPTFTPLLESLRSQKRRVIVYGMVPNESSSGKMHFKAFHPLAILEDLANCAYAIVNGGHNLICEALAFGKPLLCFPIRGQFEQFLNARAVQQLGYGDYSLQRQPPVSAFEKFETQLDRYREAIAAGFVVGTDQVIQRVREIIG